MAKDRERIAGAVDTRILDTNNRQLPGRQYVYLRNG